MEHNRIKNEIKTVTTVLDVYTHVYFKERFTCTRENKEGAIMDLIEALGLHTKGVKCVGDAEIGGVFMTKYSVTVSGYTEMVDLFKREVAKID